MPSRGSDYCCWRWQWAKVPRHMWSLRHKVEQVRFTHHCFAPHHCLSNAYSVNLNLLWACSWSTLPRMTVKRGYFSLLCLPPDEGGLIAIGGYNCDYTDVVESLDGEGATEWRRLASLPLPLDSLGGGVYFKQRILVVGGEITGYTKTSATLAFHPPTAGGLGQWVTLKPTLPRPEHPMHIAISGNSLYLVSKFTFSTWFSNLLKPCNLG